ncbi:hypothetical protein [Aeromonas veronii]|uniref:hypothetical protein n=1 Tax=Aeromonas veronii TaxID=654 RepID=UPI001F3A4E7C|nr:hypothetical protein [Aeromonas veronii]MCF5912153.1 hypothetical protein [Aeromonas veronii]
MFHSGVKLKGLFVFFIFCLSVLVVIVVMYVKAANVAKKEEEAKRIAQQQKELLQAQQVKQDVLDSLNIPEEEDALLVQYAFITMQARIATFDKQVFEIAVAELNKALVLKGITLDGLQKIQTWALEVSSRVLKYGLDREAIIALLLNEANEFLDREYPE